MIKLRSIDRARWFEWAIELMTPWEDDGEHHNLFHLKGFGRSVWFEIPEIIKPKQEWVDLSKYDWATERNGKKGYTKNIQRSYGFSTTDSDIHIHYGIQPGSWSSNDPENSDHVKLFSYPWNHKIVRWDLLLPDGSLYHRNDYKNGKSVGEHLHWYEVSHSGELSETVPMVHYTRSRQQQLARITMTGEELEWRRFGWKWFPFGKIINRRVACESDIELGERAGSWKGGLMGWSCDWATGETMEQAFWRWYYDWDGK